MVHNFVRLVNEYSSALHDYLARRDEVNLQRAYELGRFGLREGIGIIDLATVHHEALAATLLGIRTVEDAADTVKAGAGFFAESLSPFEMTHRGFRETALALRCQQEGLETEIKRIAHALHDEAGQLLASVYIALRDVDSELTPAGRAHLQTVTELLGRVECQLRRISHELRPTALDDLGLLPALEFLAEGVSLRSGLTVRIEGSTGGSLPVLVETTIYRVVQQALTNVTRHAGASYVLIRMWRQRQHLRCTICDDGCGFDVPTVLARRGSDRGLGLAGIRERVAALGGTLRIDSTPDRGTELDVAIPLEASDVTEHPAGG